jgi:uncharacterized iron-regulated membrane protein
MALTQQLLRKIWLKLHLYLGLFAGAIFVLIGLTGSFLAFDLPIDEWLNPELMTVPIVSQNETYRPLDEIVAAGMQVLPVNGKLLSLGFPRQQGLAFDLWFEQPSSNPENMERHQIFVNPYTAQVTGQRLLIDFEKIWRDPLKDFILRLHYSLGFASTGMTIVGFIGMGLLFLVLTGLILWWPKTGKYKTALTIKRNASSERFVFDLHKSVGVYGSIILLFLIMSGVYLIFPDYGRLVVNMFSPVPDPWPQLQSTLPNGKTIPINLAEVLIITDERFQGGDYRWIGFPQNERDVYQVGKREVNEVNQKMPYRCLWLDQYSGKILHIRESKTASSGEVFEQWLYPLHTGEAFGIIGQSIILVMGFVPLVLYTTGYIRWLQKRRVKNRLM